MTQPPTTHGLPPEEEAVRRLLADARHDEPTPPEVVARLDATLASLAAEREPAAHRRRRTTTAPVIDLGARAAGWRASACSPRPRSWSPVSASAPACPRCRAAPTRARPAGDAATSQREARATDAGGGADSGGAAERGAGAREPEGGPDRPGGRRTRRSPRDDADLDEELLPLRAGSPGARRVDGHASRRPTATSAAPGADGASSPRGGRRGRRGRLPPRGRRVAAGGPLRLRRPDRRAHAHAARALTRA